MLIDGARDPGQAMREARLLGVDTVRAFLTWERVAPAPRSRTMPAGFDPTDPAARGYDWSVYDRFVREARRNGLKVMFDIAPGIPYWGSREPKRCPHFIGGYRRLGKGCFWKPSPRRYGQFVAAAARRYGRRAGGPLGGQVAYWSLMNEPNLEHYLYPQRKRTRHGTVDLGARQYRELWYAGWRSIRRYDPKLRGRVLFGETAAISSPMDTLYAALCMRPDGRPFRGRLRRLQGCSKPRRLPVGGFAIHPYNADASGGPRKRAGSSDSLSLAHVPRLKRLMRRAARLGRIPRGRGIYVTEMGFQSRPPDRQHGLSLAGQARAINESDRLFWADPAIRTTSQFELFDPPQPGKEDIYQTGLRLLSGAAKPSLAAFRLPLVVTRTRSRSRVVVWGQARPARKRTRVRIQVRPRGAKRWRTVRRRRTSRAGFINVSVRRRGAARSSWRILWTAPDRSVLTSRIARAGRPLHYRRR